MGLRRVPRRGRVILIGLRPGVKATCGTQAGDHQHDDRHGTSDPRHSEFLSLSKEAATRLRDWRLEPADRPALRRAVAADSTQRESLRYSAGPLHWRPAHVRPHPGRVRRQEASVASLSPVAARKRAIAEAVGRNPNPQRHLPAASARAILEPGAGCSSQASSNNPGHTPAWGNHRIHRSARWSSGRYVSANRKAYTPSHRCPALRPSLHYEASP